MRDARFFPACLHECVPPPKALRVVRLSLQPKRDAIPAEQHCFELPLAEAERISLAILEAVAVQRYRSKCDVAEREGIPALANYIADPGRRAQLARDLDTDPVYLWQLATRWRNKRPSPEMAMRIEAATGGEVAKETLRPDIWSAADPVPLAKAG